MRLEDLIDKTNKELKKIKEQHFILETFQRINPWHVTEVLNALKKEGAKNVPSFEETISFREDFLITGFDKIYHQVKKHNPLLLEDESQTIYFYVIKPGMYKKQLKKGFSLGDRDDKGHLVTGSDLTIDIASISLSDFLPAYYTQNN